MGEEAAESPYRDIYTVSRLNNEVRELLELSFPLLWVEGEVSNLARPASGHFYFSLKDASSQVRCARFRTQNRMPGLVPRNGQKVLVRARVSLYSPRGDFQLIVEYLEEFGEGALRRAFEILKQRLSAEGLFEPANKQPLPAPPRRIGVITSPSGAAVRDVLTVLRRRFPAIPVLIYPVPVQGAAAACAIAEAVRLAGERAECNVLILARGGGSLEDLQAFNEESVARAIHTCPIPLVTGIGHEVDFTIADFVADVRAATPSAAAETVSPDQAEIRGRLSRRGVRLYTLMAGRLRRERERLTWLARRLRHPRRHLLEIAQRLDGLSQRLAGAYHRLHSERRMRLHEAAGRLQRHSPAGRLRDATATNRLLGARLGAAWQRDLAARRARIAALARALDAVSPLATVQRGYAIVTAVPDGRPVCSVDDAGPGQVLDARLVDGVLRCTVTDRLRF